MADIEVQDIWYKRQRWIRTLVQTGIPAFLTFALVLPQIIDALGLPVDGPVYLWLVGAAGIVTAVATALSRVMAIPAVNAWLTKIGLGSVPKSEAQTEDLSHLTVNGQSVDSDGPAHSTETPAEPAAESDVLVDGDGLGADQTK